MKRDREILKFIETYGSITINQTAKIFYKGHKFAYDEARRRLKKIAEVSKLKKITNKVTREFIYYMDKPVSPHNLFVLDFYSELINQGCEDIKFEKSKKWSIKEPICDGYFEFSFNDITYFMILEVDLTHNCNLKKYEFLYDTGELQEIYSQEYGNKDIFPTVVVMKQYIPTSPYYSNKFNVVYIDYKLTNFAKNILV